MTDKDRMSALPAVIRDHYRLWDNANQYGPLLTDICRMLADGSLTQEVRLRIVESGQVAADPRHRQAELELVLSFLTSALTRRNVDRATQAAFAALKQLFGIREGEFLESRNRIREILVSHLEPVLQDEIVDPAEDAELAWIQDALDLGYDSYMALTRQAWERAASRLELQIATEKETRKRQALDRKKQQLEPLLRLARAQDGAI